MIMIITFFFVGAESLRADVIKNFNPSFFSATPKSIFTEHFSPSDDKIGFSKSESPDTFSVLHLNIRSLRKNFEYFKEPYKTLNLKFSIICFSETWADDNKLENDSLIQLHGYNVYIR